MRLAMDIDKHDVTCPVRGSFWYEYWTLLQTTLGTTEIADPPVNMYRLQQDVQRPQLYIQTDLPKTVMSTFLAIHPHRWTKDDVRQWLEWCIEEYALEGVQVDKFACMNGKALCVLTKQNFNERAKNVGDVLFNTLQQRLVAATSPEATVLIQPGFFGPGLVPTLDHKGRPSYDARHLGVAPASPHDYYSIQSPLAAASPPIMKSAIFSRQHSMPARPCNSYHPFSRSPSPRSNSPLNLKMEANPESPNRQPTSHMDYTNTRDHSHRHLAMPAPAGRRAMTPSPPHLSPRGAYNPRFHRQVSEGGCYHQAGGKSPSRRPSPSLSLPEPASKMAKLGTSGHSTSSPFMSPNYLSITPQPREPSPEGFRDIRDKLAFTRLDSRDDSLRYQEDPTTPHTPTRVFLQHQHSLLDTRQVEPISDPEPETEGSDFSGGGSDSPLEESGPIVGVQHGNGGGLVSQGVLSRERHLTGKPMSNGVHSAEGQRVHAGSIHTLHNQQIPLTVKSAETSDDFYNPDKPDGEGGQGDTKLLWEFIYQLLRSPDYTSLLRWEDEARLVFRIINPSKLAYLWGLQKSRDNMTYEKLSRALRYYYRMNIIVKEPHRRLTYRFVKPPEHIQRGQKGAKPGVAHKRRSSGDVPRMSVSTPSVTSPDATPSPLCRKEEEMRENVFKPELPAASSNGGSFHNTAVFPTNMPFNPYFEPGLKFIREDSGVRPESLSCAPAVCTSAQTVVPPTAPTQGTIVYNTPTTPIMTATSTTTSGPFCLDLKRDAALPEVRTLMDHAEDVLKPAAVVVTAHVQKDKKGSPSSPMEEGHDETDCHDNRDTHDQTQSHDQTQHHDHIQAGVVKGHSPRLSPINNNTDCKDYELSRSSNIMSEPEVDNKGSP